MFTLILNHIKGSFHRESFVVNIPNLEISFDHFNQLRQQVIKQKINDISEKVEKKKS